MERGSSPPALQVWRQLCTPNPPAVHPTLVHTTHQHCGRHLMVVRRSSASDADGATAAAAQLVCCACRPLSPHSILHRPSPARTPAHREGRSQTSCVALRANGLWLHLHVLRTVQSKVSVGSRALCSTHVRCRTCICPPVPPAPPRPARATKARAGCGGAGGVFCVRIRGGPPWHGPSRAGLCRRRSGRGRPRGHRPSGPGRPVRSPPHRAARARRSPGAGSADRRTRPHHAYRRRTKRKKAPRSAPTSPSFRSSGGRGGAGGALKLPVASPRYVLVQPRHVQVQLAAHHLSPRGVLLSYVLKFSGSAPR